VQRTSFARELIRVEPLEVSVELMEEPPLELVFEKSEPRRVRQMTYGIKENGSVSRGMG
jgi:hypothetical protein